MPKSPETQPQRITSPDETVQIINHRASREGFGSYCIEGAVRNISSEPEINAEIRVDYYDGDNVKIDSEVDVLPRLKPGETRGIYISYAGQKRNSVQYYRLHLSQNKKTGQ